MNDSMADRLSALRVEIEDLAALAHSPNVSAYPDLVNDLAPIYLSLTDACVTLLGRDFNPDSRSDRDTLDHYASACNLITDRLSEFDAS